MPSFPASAVSRIVYHLRGDKTTLLACAALSRSWVWETRYYLFEEIHLRARGSLTRFSEFAVFLESCPGVRPFIRGLKLHGYDKWQTVIPPLLRPETLYCILTMLPKLFTLQLVRLDFQPAATVPVPRLPDQHCLTVLKMAHLGRSQERPGFNGVGLIHVLGMFPQVTQMDFEEIWDIQFPLGFREEDIRSLVSRPYQLKCASFGFTTGGGSCTLFIILHCLLAKRSLRRVEFHCKDAAEMCAAAPLLRENPVYFISFMTWPVSVEKFPEIPVANQFLGLGLSHCQNLHTFHVVVAQTCHSTPTEIFYHFKRTFYLISTLPRTTTDIRIELQDESYSYDSIAWKEKCQEDFDFWKVMHALEDDWKKLDSLLAREFHNLTELWFSIIVWDNRDWNGALINPVSEPSDFISIRYDRAILTSSLDLAEAPYTENAHGTIMVDYDYYASNAEYAEEDVQSSEGSSVVEERNTSEDVWYTHNSDYGIYCGHCIRCFLAHATPQLRSQDVHIIVTVERL